MTNPSHNESAKSDEKYLLFLEPLQVKSLVVKECNESFKNISTNYAATFKSFKTIPHKSEGFIGTTLKVELFLVKLQIEISLYTCFST